MSRPGFAQGVLIAAVLSVAAAAVGATLLTFMALGSALRILIPLLGFAYILYLLRQSDERTGRVTIVTLYLAISVLVFLLAPPLALTLLVTLTSVWLIRALYYYAGVIPAALDLGLSALALSAAIWAFGHTGSVLLATWCFFLVQALFVVIPASLRETGAKQQTSTTDKFERARRQADAALRQLLTQ